MLTVMPRLEHHRWRIVNHCNLRWIICTVSSFGEFTPCDEQEFDVTQTILVMVFEPTIGERMSQRFLELSFRRIQFFVAETTFLKINTHQATHCDVWLFGPLRTNGYAVLNHPCVACVVP
jgi:hypothetical protein